MTHQQLEAKLTSNIKDYLKSEGHVKTGRLLASIQVNVEKPFKMSISGLEYMQGLDEGQFLQNFFDLPSTLALLEEFLASQLEDDIG